MSLLHLIEHDVPWRGKVLPYSTPCQLIHTIALLAWLAMTDGILLSLSWWQGQTPGVGVGRICIYSIVTGRTRSDM